jgi:hypothetical protein
LSVTLVWTDIPAQAGCKKCLINDVDLMVVRNSTGQEYYPNGLAKPDRTNSEFIFMRAISAMPYILNFFFSHLTFFS